MILTHNQKAGLRMLANGHKPRTVTLEALHRRRLISGPLHRPTLTDAGKHVLKYGELPNG